MTLDLTSLNPAQRQAVETTEGPLLVLAGAGSGKTRVLTYRIAHLITDKRVSPHEILAITFTNKAAAEMRERLATLLGSLPGQYSSRAMWVSTFHAMCVRMLRTDAKLLGFTSNFTIYDDDDSKRLVREVMKELEYDDKRYPINAVRSRISSAKSELMGAAALAESSFTPLDKAAAKIFARYETRLLAANSMDFDDLLVNTHRLLSENVKVLDAYQDRFRYISVDEYQDTNHAQYAITNLLAAKHRHLMVVGDDDQSIYSWRGADIRNILEFEHDYPEATVVKLEENYRSTARILMAANAVVANNTNRKPKTLFTSNAEGEKIASYLASDERDEARFIAGEIERLGRAEHRRYTDFAIFYRTNAQSRSLEDALLRAGIAYKIVGGTRFFDRAEIRDVMGYLKAVVNPADEISLKRIINTPKRGIGDSTIDKVQLVARERNVGFEDAMRAAVEEDWLAARARMSLLGFTQILDELRVLEGDLRDLVEMIVEKAGLIAAYEAERTDEALGRAENIREFFTVVSEFAASHDEPSLPAFMEWLALRTDLDSVDECVDEFVTLMTVHTAKGLEYPVVFVAGLEESIFPHQNSMFEPASLEEERRLAYVAITRARERLYLTHAYSRSIFGVTQHNSPSRFIGEIPAEHVEASGVGSVGFSGTGWEKRGDRSGSYGHGTAESGGRVFGSGTRQVPAAGSSAGGGAFGARSAGPKRKEQTETFSVGDAVDHKVFGRGTVTTVNGDALEIRFDRTRETKKLLVGYAPIVKIKQ
ncbi:MAG: DNA helicase UvrD [Actinobacteria bacterium HGW-Actinobacteria-7]|nr:MAG: DNA helicase UvrD [Actinobacteria bacterium HGW-Actinobacteria-7]